MVIVIMIYSDLSVCFENHEIYNDLRKEIVTFWQV
jgi:hypothetical protein